MAPTAYRLAFGVADGLFESGNGVVAVLLRIRTFGIGKVLTVTVTVTVTVDDMN